MRSDEIKAIFDQMASSYDDQWGKTMPIRDGLLFLLEAVFAGLPDNARILCVGAGTGEEIVYLATRFPQWTFAAVDPSSAMLDVCRNKAEKQGFGYKASMGHSLNHFYEKLLLLKERMNTGAGKRLAEERHLFMEEFISRFLAEWNCGPTIG